MGLVRGPELALSPEADQIHGSMAPLLEGLEGVAFRVTVSTEMGTGVDHMDLMASGIRQLPGGCGSGNTRPDHDQSGPF